MKIHICLVTLVISVVGVLSSPIHDFSPYTIVANSKARWVDRLEPYYYPRASRALMRPSTSHKRSNEKESPRRRKWDSEDVDDGDDAIGFMTFPPMFPGYPTPGFIILDAAANTKKGKKKQGPKSKAQNNLAQTPTTEKVPKIRKPPTTLSPQSPPSGNTQKPPPKSSQSQSQTYFHSAPVQAYSETSPQSQTPKGPLLFPQQSSQNVSLQGPIQVSPQVTPQDPNQGFPQAPQAPKPPQGPPLSALQGLPSNPPQGPSPNYSSQGPPPNYSSQGSSPNYSFQGPPPNYSYQGPSPNYSSQGPSPNYSPQGPPPNYSSQGSSPNYSSQGPPPNYSSQGPSPNYSSQGPSPNYSSQGPPPNYSSQGSSPNYSSQEPPPNYSSQGSSPNYSSQGPSPNYSSQRSPPNYLPPGPSQSLLQVTTNPPSHGSQQGLHTSSSMVPKYTHETHIYPREMPMTPSEYDNAHQNTPSQQNGQSQWSRRESDSHSHVHSRSDGHSHMHHETTEHQWSHDEPHVHHQETSRSGPRKHIHSERHFRLHTSKAPVRTTTIKPKAASVADAASKIPISDTFTKVLIKTRSEFDDSADSNTPKSAVISTSITPAPFVTSTVPVTKATTASLASPASNVAVGTVSDKVASVVAEAVAAAVRRAVSAAAAAKEPVAGSHPVSATISETPLAVKPTTTPFK